MSYLTIPVIFLAIGYKFDEDKARRDPISSAQSLIVSTLVPYLLLSFVFLAANGLSTNGERTLLYGDPSSLGTIAQVLWFLPALLIAELVFETIILTLPRYRFLPIFLLGFIGASLPSALPWQLQAALLSLPLLFIGFAFGRTPLHHIEEGPLTLLMGAGMMSAAAIVIGPASFRTYTPIGYALFLIGSVGGGLVLMQLGRWFSRIDSRPMADLFHMFARHIAIIPSCTVSFAMLVAYLHPAGTGIYFLIATLFVGIMLSLCLCWCVDRIWPHIPSLRREKSAPAAMSPLFHVPVTSGPNEKK